MSLNRVILSGAIGQYGVKIRYTEQGKPQTSFTLVCEEPGNAGVAFKTFVTVLIVGSKSEDLAETLEAGDYVELEGKLQFKAGKTKDAGKLVVSCFTVEVLQRPVVTEAAATYEGAEEVHTP